MRVGGYLLREAVAAAPSRQVAAAVTSALFKLVMSDEGSMRQVRHDITSRPHSSSGSQDEVLPKAQLAARASHEAILPAFPSLTGAASTSLSTALRVRNVRDAFADHSVRGIPLGKWVGYVANAADAGRHLTCGVIDEVITELRNV